MAASLPPLALVLTLIGPALDLMAIVQPATAAPAMGLMATLAAGAVLGVSWVRSPRTGWLAAATVAAVSSVALRAMSAEIAPLLSLLAVVALGIGGAFASPGREAEAWLA